jgi:DNA anti-recombination protein RmuC
MRFVLTLSLILALAVAGPVVAQAPTEPPATDAALAAKLARDAELADQNRRSEALNAEVNARNRAVQARNDAATAAFNKAAADYKAALAQHDAQVQAIAAEAARTQAAYQKSMDDWKSAVAACKAGDVSKCQAKAAAPPT